jgi:hypothetical protein
VSDENAARVLERSLRGFRGQLTAADAAARSGLPTRDAAEGLATLAADYAGHLAVTDKGELIYDFPRGLVRDDRPGVLRRMGRALVKVAAGAVRLVVRAWVSVVLVGYVVVFGAVLIAIAAKSDDSDGIGDVLAVLGRVLFEALYWTFHPFSPFRLAGAPVTGRRRHRIADVPFYERVNRFVFGPPAPAIDPRAETQKLLVEIRRQQGRVAPADVMRVTGSSREAAERSLLRLVADHDGEITVSEEGAILYEFPALRSTAGRGGTGAGSDRLARATPAWQQLAKVPPLTGNGAGFNVLFTILNGFNLTVSGVALSQGWTIERLVELGARIGVQDAPPLPPPDGIPLVLGLVPFVFSTALFAMPMLRALRRRVTAARVAHENHLRLVLRRLLADREETRRFEYTLPELSDACTIDGRRPGQADVERAVRALGGTVDVKDDGRLVYVFDDLAREHAAVRRSRALASADEALPGRVLLSSADEGHGLRDD